MTHLVTHPIKRCVSFILALFLIYFCLGKTAIAAAQTPILLSNNDNNYHNLAQDISKGKSLTANTNQTDSEFPTKLKDVIEKEKSIASFPTLLANGTGTTSYIWPISNSATPDEMNTSFGPRINDKNWDFHDGIDLPEDCGTDVHAVANGTVVDAGDADSNNSSRHVVLKVNDSTDGDIYVYYLHLKSIAVSLGPVSQGDILGKVGEDNATYCHLHLEFRRGNRQQISSYHPLRYLPYTNTANFTAPTSARFNRQSNGLMAAQLLFDASSRLEGDLERVEVDLKDGTNPSVTARLRKTSGLILPGIAAKKSIVRSGESDIVGENSNEAIATGVWSKWKLHVSRIGTREMKAVLYLDDQEKTKLSWDSTAYEPLKLRVGIGRSSSLVKATVNTDDVVVTEKTL